MQFVMDCLGVNSRGNLEMGGCDLVEIAREFGTPAYVMDENKIRENCRAYTDAIDEYYDGNGLALYASKALSCKAIYRIMKEERMGVDVVSGGELYTAISAGFPAEKIYFHGNNKTEGEIRLAIENKVGRIIVDNVNELETIERVSGEMGVTTDILFRIKPGIDAHTHSFIQTGQIDCKFGVALENGEAHDFVKKVCDMKNVNLVGVHCHIGSQIFELDPFELAAKVMIGFIADIKKEFSIDIQELNLGGGFGIKYVEEDTPIDFGKYIKAVSEVVNAECERLGLTRPRIIMEPGRSIVATAGLTLYTVGNVKEIKDVRTYVSVDGGMADNPRFIMYGAEYEALLVENPNGERVMTATVAGKCCESGDILIENAKLPETRAGDILAVLTTGAYNYSMASNYNRIPRPPIVMIKDGKASLAVRRENYEDIIACDL